MTDARKEAVNEAKEKLAAIYGCGVHDERVLDWLGRIYDAGAAHGLKKGMDAGDFVQMMMRKYGAALREVRDRCMDPEHGDEAPEECINIIDRALGGKS